MIEVKCICFEGLDSHKNKNLRISIHNSILMSNNKQYIGAFKETLTNDVLE